MINEINISGDYCKKFGNLEECFGNYVVTLDGVVYMGNNLNSLNANGILDDFVISALTHRVVFDFVNPFPLDLVVLNFNDFVPASISKGESGIAEIFNKESLKPFHDVVVLDNGIVWMKIVVIMCLVINVMMHKMLLGPLSA